MFNRQGSVASQYSRQSGEGLNSLFATVLIRKHLVVAKRDNNPEVGMGCTQRQNPPTCPDTLTLVISQQTCDLLEGLRCLASAQL